MTQTGVVSWSQTAVSNATADSNVNEAEGMAPSQVNDSARAIMASVAKWRDDLAGSLVTGGTSTVYTLTTNQGFGSTPVLVGQKLSVRFHATCGASPTLTVDGITGWQLLIDETTAVAQGAIRKNAIHELTFVSGVGAIVHNGHSLIEPGRISQTGATTAPNGWLLCDGSAVSRTTFADLFANISTAYGTGNGTTTFNVPDLRGRVAVGVDASAVNLSGVTVPGAALGAGTSAILQANLPAVNFAVSGITLNNGAVTATAHISNSGTITGATSAFELNGGSTTNDLVADTNLSIGTNVTVSAQGTAASGGSGTPLSVVQPTIATNFIIKV